PLRERTRVILQSARSPGGPPQPGTTVCVLAHLRPVKDPLRPAHAARLLPSSSGLRVVLLGAALDPALAAEARALEGPRFAWLGDRPRCEALRLLAGCRLLAIPSLAEGGANALSEGLAAGLPIVCSAIPGSLGILELAGGPHPGAHPPGDTRALATL